MFAVLRPARLVPPQHARAVALTARQLADKAPAPSRAVPGFVVGPEMATSSDVPPSIASADNVITQHFMRKAEQFNESRAKDWHRRAKRNKFTIAGLFAFVFSIYFYTMWAMGQDPDLFADDENDKKQ